MLELWIVRLVLPSCILAYCIPKMDSHVEDVTIINCHCLLSQLLKYIWHILSTAVSENVNVRE